MSTGLLESAVRDQPERTLALTLMRSTRTTVFTNGEPNGQLLGDWTFRYWLVPLAGEPDRVQLSRLGQQLAAGLRNVQLRREDLPLLRQASFAAIQRQHAGGWRQCRRHEHPLGRRCAGSAHVQPDDGGRRGAAALWRGMNFTHMQQVDSESNPLEPAQSLTGGEAAVAMAAKQIKTLRFS